MSPSFQSAYPKPNLELIHQGKVRDVYAIDDQHLLFVASDRISAFDVVLPNTIPGKGKLLTQISRFWFNRTEHIVQNHMSDLKLEDVIKDSDLASQLEPRSMIVKHLKPLPIEAIVRGYLIGSGWKDYLITGKICGQTLPAGMQQAAKLHQVLFTPSTKASVGDHDINITFRQMTELIGEPLSEQIQEVSLNLYEHAARHASDRGIILADSKFEFGLDDLGRLVLMDELFTPDSSRFWPANDYKVDTSPPSFDKQIIRDYLETLDWNKAPPGPSLPGSIIKRTQARYNEAWQKLTGRDDEICC